MIAVVDKLYVGCLNKDASRMEVEEVCSIFKKCSSSLPSSAKQSELSHFGILYVCTNKEWLQTQDA